MDYYTVVKDIFIVSLDADSYSVSFSTFYVYHTAEVNDLFTGQMFWDTYFVQGNGKH